MSAILFVCIKQEEEEEEEIVYLNCDQCSKKFRAQRRLDLHKDNYHGDEKQCDKCDYVAKNKITLK